MWLTWVNVHNYQFVPAPTPIRHITTASASLAINNVEAM